MSANNIFAAQAFGLCVSAAVTVSVFASTPALASNPDGIIARYESWRGGGAFIRLKGLHERGIQSAGGLTGPLELWAARDGRLRQEADLGTGKVITVAGSGGAWATNLSGQVQALSPSERLEAQREAALLFDAPLHRENGATVSQRADEILDGRPRQVVRLSYDNGSTYDYFLDAGSGALFAVRSHANGNDRVTRYRDWRMAGAVRVPFEEDVTGQVASDASTTRYSAVDIEPELAGTLFEKPAATNHVRFASGAASSGWVPFEFYGGSRIYIPARINGRPVTLLLDSGAQATVIDRGFADRMSLDAKGEVTAHGTGGTSTAGLASGVDIAIGKMSLTGLTAAVIDLADVGKAIGHPLPLILGAEVFEESIVEIDFKGRRIAFHDPSAFLAPVAASILQVSTANGLHVVPAKIEGRSVLLDFDLGNGSPLLLNPNFWNAPGFLAGRRTTTALAGAVGGMKVVKETMVRNLEIGSTTFPGVPATLMNDQAAGAASGQTQGNVGLPILSRFRLIVDFPHDRVLLAPPVDATTPLPIDHSGLAVQRVADGLKVMHVAAGSPAMSAGILANDVITMVNDVPAGRVGRQDGPIAEWRYAPPGTKLTLKLASGVTHTLALAVYY